MEKKKRKIEKQKFNQENENKEKADKIRENLMCLNAKSYLLVAKNMDSIKSHCKTSKMQKFLAYRPEFSLET